MAVFAGLSAISVAQLFISHQKVFPGLARNYDLLCYAGRFRFFGSQAFYDFNGQVFNYPAPVALLYRFFYLTPDPVLTYRLLIAAWAIVAGSIFIRACVKRGVSKWPSAAFAMISLFFFPVVLMTFLGNMEMIVWIVLSVGVWAYLTGRRLLAAVCFGLAGSFKYYQLGYLFLFAPSEWRKVLTGISVFGLSMLGSLWAVGPSVGAALAGMKVGTAEFADKYLYRWNPNESGIDHSAFAVMKLWVAPNHTVLLPLALDVYMVAVLVLLLAAYFQRIRHLSGLSQLLALSVAAVWLWPLSHDYTLVELCAPLVALTLYAIASPNQRGMGAMFCCFGGQVRCFALAMLFILILRNDLPERLPPLSHSAPH
jgi:hypothetical protein